MAVLEALTEEECYLLAILEDESGLDLCEFTWYDHTRKEDGCWRAWDFQVRWFRCKDKFQIDQCGRAVGKSQSIAVRAFAFPFLHPQEEMVITAPERVHLDAITDKIETQLLNTRITREMLQGGGGRNSIKHQPFHVNFANGSRIMGRIPQRDGRGVKGTHPIWLEMDEAQDYPKAGWDELIETLNTGFEGAVWRAHGVTRGVRDEFYKHSQPDSGWTVHRMTAMHKPFPHWSDAIRQDKLEQYGSKDDPNYRRNILGLHGDATNPLFVLHRLMQCWQGDTPVWVFEDSNKIVAKPIKDVRIGDRVVNAIGHGEITMVRKVTCDKVIRITLDNGEELVCSDNHPSLTTRGWVYADDLEVGDEFVSCDADLRDVFGSVPVHSEQAFLLATVLGEVGWEDLSGLGYEHEDVQILRAMWGAVLSALEGGEVLLAALRQQGNRIQENSIEDAALCSMWQDLQTMQDGSSFLHDEMFVRFQNQGQARQEMVRSTYVQGRQGRVALPAVPVMAGTVSGGLVESVLDLALGRPAGSSEHGLGSGAPIQEDHSGSGWKTPHLDFDSRKGPSSRRMAGFPRVAGLEILERGDPRFGEISGGQDSIELYDLTVSGHPSYAVGISGIITHNCVDQEDGSDYNLFTYQYLRLSDESLKDKGLSIRDALDFNLAHKHGYINYWAGMDIGFTNHPSEILVFGEKKGKREESTVLELLTRIHLERISEPDQVEAIARVVEFYRPKTFALDSTGVGLPLFQHIQHAYPEMLPFLKGYNFSSKILVDFDASMPVDEWTGDPSKEAQIEKNVLEYAQDSLRGLVDVKRILLPWDRELIGQFQGGTYTTRPGHDQYGRRKIFSSGDDHALDAARMAALGFTQWHIEQLMMVDQQAEVLDVFMEQW